MDITNVLPLQKRAYKRPSVMLGFILIEVREMCTTEVPYGVQRQELLLLLLRRQCFDLTTSSEQ